MVREKGWTHLVKWRGEQDMFVGRLQFLCIALVDCTEMHLICALLLLRAQPLCIAKFVSTVFGVFCAFLIIYSIGYIVSY